MNEVCNIWKDNNMSLNIKLHIHVNCGLCYSNTTVYYWIHERSECIPVDCSVTNLIHDRRSCVDFTLEVEANAARCVHSSVNKLGVKRNSGLYIYTFISPQG